MSDPYERDQIKGEYTLRLEAYVARLREALEQIVAITDPTEGEEMGDIARRALEDDDE